MLAHDIAAADGQDLVIRELRTALSRGIGEPEGGSGGRILLVDVVGFDEGAVVVFNNAAARRTRSTSAATPSDVLGARRTARDAGLGAQQVAHGGLEAVVPMSREAPTRREISTAASVPELPEKSITTSAQDRPKTPAESVIFGAGPFALSTAACFESAAEPARSTAPTSMKRSSSCAIWQSRAPIDPTRRR